MKSLQTLSMLSLFNNLTKNIQEEFISEILKTMTLDEIIKHPVVIEHYRHVIESRDWVISSGPVVRYLVHNTHDPILIFKLYSNEYLSLMEPKRWERCMHIEDKLVIINEYYDSFVGFKLYNVVEFDFKRDIIDSGISLENVYELRESHHIANPYWYPGSNLHQAIPDGQKEVCWWDSLLTDY